MPISSFKGDNVKTNLNFILQMRAQRIAQQQAAAQLAFDKEKFAHESKVAAHNQSVEDVKTSVELRKAVREQQEAAALQKETFSNRERAQDIEFDVNPAGFQELIQGLHAPTGEAVSRASGRLDAFNQNAAANEAAGGLVLAEADRLQGLPTSPLQGIQNFRTGGQLGVATDRAQAARDAEIELRKTIATEQRGEQITIRGENRSTANQLKVWEQKERRKPGIKMETLADLGVYIKGLRKEISRAKANDDDTTIRESMLTDALAQQSNMRAGNRISIDQAPPISASSLEHNSSVLFNSDRGIAHINRLVSDAEAGKLKFGAKGFVANVLARGVGVAREYLEAGGFRDEKSGELDALVAEALRNGEDTIEMNWLEGVEGVDVGTQLSLGLDQVSLAYDFIKSTRESARFTLLEFQKVLAELKLTGPFRLESEIRKNLGKIQRRLFESKRGAEAVFRYHKVDPAAFGGSADLTPEQEAAILRTEGGSVRVNPAPTRTNADTVPRGDDGKIGADDFNNMDPLDALEALERQQGGAR